MCAYTRSNYFAGFFGLGNDLVAVGHVVPTARFPLLYWVVDRHGWGLYRVSGIFMKGKGVAKVKEKTPPLPKGNALTRRGGIIL